MTKPDETAPNDNRHSWLAMPWRDRSGGIWAWSMPAGKHEIALPDMRAGGKIVQRNWA